jgi:SAM-dependent methyltransferase
MTITQESEAYAQSFAYYDDNTYLLSAALEQIIRRTQNMPSIRLLSLGVGFRQMVDGLFHALGERLARHVIVEGSLDIIELFRKELSPPDCVSLVHAFFENFDTDERFDIIEMGFVLEHVDDPDMILERFKAFLAPGGRIMIAVPNAHSLHRLIGKQAGLMDDLYALSEADRALGHRRYFDPETLSNLLARHNLEIIGRAGLMLKPFTSGQLATLELTSGVREAMNEVGFNLPDICNGIFVEAQPCR